MWGQPFLARALHAEVAASVRLADAPQELVHTLEQVPSVPGTAPTTLHTCVCVWVCSQERHSPGRGGALEKASEGEGCTVVGLEQSRGSFLFFFLMFIIYFWPHWVLGAVGAFL